MPSFILASQSPRRKNLLEWAELDFKVMVSDSDESFPASLTISAIPEYIAKNKALAVEAKIKNEHPQLIDHCIIAADTVVVLNNTIMGKPIDRADAIASLSKLSGKTHQVITGVCILYKDKLESFSETTEVVFHELTKEQIEYYVDHYQPYDKAGGYAIQEWIGVIGIKKIVGDFYNVMGLPVSKLVQKIKQLNLL